MKQKFFKSFYAVFLFTGIMQAQVQVFTVTSDDDDGPGTLRQVIANAAAGDTITFDEKVKHIKLTTGQIEIKKSITIKGNGVQDTKIDGDAKGRIFYIPGSDAIDVTLKDILLTNAAATSSNGGAICAYNTNLTVINLELSDNDAQSGGGISASGGTLVMINSNLINNTARNMGGALEVQGAIVNITDTNISGNTALTGGGIALLTETVAFLDKVTLRANNAFSNGGGLTVINGRLTISNSAIINNATLYYGGGLYFDSNLSADISTATFSGNNATIGSGGAIFNVKSLTFTLNAVTVVNNTAFTGSGIFNDTGLVTLKNTIVAQNDTSFGYPDIATNSNNKFKSSGYNLIGQDKSAAFTATTGDLVGTETAPIDPKVGPLANNGGSTLTHQLLKGSPAYNTGAEDPEDLLIKDQIGQTVFGGRRDIGAYEAQEDLLGNTVFDLKNSNSTVWPNPSNGTIKINLSAALGTTAKGQLIAIGSGKTISEFTVNDNSEINLQQYAAGLYIVRLESESVTENHKLIIQ